MAEPEHDSADAEGVDDLDELKDLLAAEGVTGDDGWSPDQVLAEADAEVDADEAVGRGRRPRAARAGRDRRAADEQVFRDLDSQLQAGALEVRVADDRLSVAIGRLGPENSLDEVRAELRRHKVTAALDEKAIAAALRQAAGGAPQYKVVVAHGTPPTVRRPPRLRYHLPRTLAAADPQPLASLQQALAGPSLEMVEKWRGPVHVVHNGDVLADIAPAEVEAGVDVFGAPVEPELGPPPALPHGENTQLREDELAVVASLYGYAGLVGDDPTVVVPLFVARDAMEACFIVVRGETMPAPTPEEFAELLQARWIEHGVDEAAVQRLCQELDSGRALDGRSHRMALGRPPRHGRDGQLIYSMPPASLARWGDLQALLKAKGRQALEAAIADLRGSGRRLSAVHAGDLLVTRQPAVDGEPGMDVHGEELAAEDGKDVELKGGLNTKAGDDGLQLRATCFGLAAVYGSDQISVVAPLWIAADRLSLCYLNLHQGDAPCVPTPEEFEALVEADLDLSGWPALATQLQKGRLRDAVVEVCRGQAPQPGQDGRFDWAIEVGSRAGRILADGSIDLRDRRLITVVQAGDHIGTAWPATPGTPGRDIFGTELAPPSVVQVEVTGDSRIEARPGDDGRVDYHALEEGGVSFTEEVRRKRGGQTRRLRLSLFAVSEISGDVDYNTGHIEFSGDVVIEGSVKPLFRVRASGAVTIGGNVEPGAWIEAGGDIAVAGGVVGDKTVLQAGGGVQAKFVQQAQVRCGGDLEVGSYLFEASVRAGGDVTIAGRGDGGGRALVGGMVWAGGAVETPSLGSPSNPRLRLVVGVDPATVAQADALRGRLRTCEARLEGQLGKLRMKQLDAPRLQRRVQRVRGEEREVLLQTLKGLADLGLLRRDLRRRLEELAAAQRESARHGRLTVAGPIFAGADLRIGEHALHIDADTSKQRYRLVEDEEGRLAIQAEDV